MHAFVAIFFPVALLPAAITQVGDARMTADRGWAAEQKAQVGQETAATDAFRAVEEARRPPVAHQVRIERRVTIRIAPSTAALRERMLSALPRRSSTNTYEEQRLRGCIELDGIAAVQPAQENRLLLFMDDRRVLTAALDRSCNAEEFYSGFYVERAEDGQLCSRRDELRSRSGANCRVAQLNRLVAVRD